MKVVIYNNPVDAYKLGLSEGIKELIKVWLKRTIAKEYIKSVWHFLKENGEDVKLEHPGVTRFILILGEQV